MALKQLKSECIEWVSYNIMPCYGLAVAGNKSATWPPLPMLGWGGEWKETGRNCWVRIRVSLTEQQTKGIVTTTLQLRGKHKLHSSQSHSLLDRTGLAHALPSRE